MRLPALAFFTVLLPSVCAFAQQEDSLSIQKNKRILDSLDTFFTHQDSLDIFDLIDSLLKAEAVRDRSQLAVRIGYNSNIVADNRTFNINQFGLAPGISYYHKSGAYLDYTAYWSQEYDPHLYLSVASGGYLHSFSKGYSMLAEYSHYFYNQPSDSTVSVPYTNNVGVSNYFNIKSFVGRLDYYFYFGEKSAHRIMPNVGFNFIKRKWHKLERISFYPNAGIMFGTEEITNYSPAPNLLFRIVYNRTHTPKLPLVIENRYTEFGVMNYSFSAPITVATKHWFFLLNYTYNIPKALPGENLSLENSGYISFSITRYIGL